LNLQAQAPLALVLALGVVMTRPSVDSPTSRQTPAFTKNLGAKVHSVGQHAQLNKSTNIDEPASIRISTLRSQRKRPNLTPNQSKSQCRNLKRDPGFSSGDYGFHLQVFRRTKQIQRPCRGKIRHVGYWACSCSRR
jgi:hypothetical protein